MCQLESHNLEPSSEANNFGDSVRLTCGWQVIELEDLRE